MLRRMSQDRESQQEMTTLLQEFEEWLKEEIKFNQYDDLGQALKLAQGKLESLKKKHKIGENERQ